MTKLPPSGRSHRNHKLKIPRMFVIRNRQVRRTSWVFRDVCRGHDLNEWSRCRRAAALRFTRPLVRGRLFDSLNDAIDLEICDRISNFVTIRVIAVRRSQTKFRSKTQLQEISQFSKSLILCTTAGETSIQRRALQANSR